MEYDYESSVSWGLCQYFSDQKGSVVHSSGTTAVGCCLLTSGNKYKCPCYTFCCLWALLFNLSLKLK